MSSPAPRALGGPRRRAFSRIRLGAALALSAAALHASRAGAESDYRRPGLEGQWSHRHLTEPLNSLRIIAGPGQPTLMGERYAEQVIDGGGQYVHAVGAGSGGPVEDQWWFRGGVSFGLTEDWEAGALFVPLELSPKFQFSNVTAFVTRGFRLGALDLGVRLSFQTPSLKAYDLKGWSFNPGLPLMYRAGAFRFDTAVLVPIATRDGSVGLNLPLRASLSVTPRFFFALDTGAFDAHLTRRHDTTVPLGLLVGYTELFGSRVIDFTASFGWDDFWQPSPPAGRDALVLEHYRVGFGLVYHMLVR